MRHLAATCVVWPLITMASLISCTGRSVYLSCLSPARSPAPVSTSMLLAGLASCTQEHSGIVGGWALGVNAHRKQRAMVADLQNDQNCIPGSQFPHIPVHSRHHIRHRLSNRDQHPQKLLSSISAGQQVNDQCMLMQPQSSLQVCTLLSCLHSLVGPGSAGQHFRQWLHGRCLAW